MITRENLELIFNKHKLKITKSKLNNIINDILKLNYIDNIDDINDNNNSNNNDIISDELFDKEISNILYEIPQEELNDFDINIEKPNEDNINDNLDLDELNELINFNSQDILNDINKLLDLYKSPLTNFKDKETIYKFLIQRYPIYGSQIKDILDYRIIDKYSNYKIYEDGRIFDIKNNIFLSLYTSKDGYLSIKLYNDELNYNNNDIIYNNNDKHLIEFNDNCEIYQIHRLVYMTFHSNYDIETKIIKYNDLYQIPNDKVIDHINQIRCCNILSNLREVNLSTNNLNKGKYYNYLYKFNKEKNNNYKIINQMKYELRLPYLDILNYIIKVINYDNFNDNKKLNLIVNKFQNTLNDDINEIKVIFNNKHPFSIINIEDKYNLLQYIFNDIENYNSKNINKIEFIDNNYYNELKTKYLNLKLLLDNTREFNNIIRIKTLLNTKTDYYDYELKCNDFNKYDILYRVINYNNMKQHLIKSNEYKRINKRNHYIYYLREELINKDENIIKVLRFIYDNENKFNINRFEDFIIKEDFNTIKELYNKYEDIINVFIDKSKYNININNINENDNINIKNTNLISLLYTNIIYNAYQYISSKLVNKKLFTVNKVKYFNYSFNSNYINDINNNIFFNIDNSKLLISFNNEQDFIGYYNY